jgi:hypothetical protein
VVCQHNLVTYEALYCHLTGVPVRNYGSVFQNFNLIILQVELEGRVSLSNDGTLSTERVVSLKIGNTLSSIRDFSLYLILTVDEKVDRFVR